MIGFWAAWCVGCWLFGLTLDGVTLAEEVGGGWKEEEDTETPDPGEAAGILVEIEATLDDLKKKNQNWCDNPFTYTPYFSKNTLPKYILPFEDHQGLTYTLLPTNPM